MAVTMKRLVPMLKDWKSSLDCLNVGLLVGVDTLRVCFEDNTDEMRVKNAI